MAPQNYAFVTQDDELVTPPFDDILSGTSIRRAMVLAEALMEGSGRLLKGWVVREISVEEAKSCKEMMVLGGSFVRPITAFDDTVFGLDPSVPGPVSCRTMVAALSPMPLCQTAWAMLVLQVTKALAELIQDDMDNDAVGIPTDSAAVVDHDGSRAAFRWENVPLAEVFEQAVEEATAAARL